MAEAPLVSILIVNWNGKDYLYHCLEAVFAQTIQSREVIVIDNASTDGSPEAALVAWREIRLVRLEKNVGFAAANNLGAKLAQGRWLALLNNDAFPHPDWLEKLLEVAETHPEFSFFSSCILSANEPERIEAAGDVYHISGLAWHRAGGLSVSQVPSQGEVFSACAAAALYERQAYLEVGGFDEDYVSHHEDVDLGFRLRLQGYRCCFVPQAVVEHVGSASYGRESDLTVYRVQRNLVWTYVKNMPSPLLWKYFPAHLSANLFFLLYYTARRRMNLIWRAKRDALRGLGYMLRKRAIIQHKRRVPMQDLTSVFEQGWLSPYLLGKRGRSVKQLFRRLISEPD